MKALCTAFCVLFLINTTVAQKSSDLIGKQSPVLTFQSGSSKKLKPDFYKGKLFVLDFWATWCAPCIAGFPDFNQLSKKYSSKDVLFASISDESTDITTKFFDRTKKELNAIKLNDTSKKTMNAFSVLFLPYCIVIGKDNIVKWVGPTYKLTDIIINQIINNDPAIQLSQNIKKVSSPKKNLLDRPPIFLFSVTKSDTTNGNQERISSRNYKSNYVDLTMTNTSITSCLEQLTGFSQSTRIHTNDSLKIKQLIDLDFKAGTDTSRFAIYRNAILRNKPRINMLVTLLGESMQFNTTVVRQKQKHYELIITDTAKLFKFRSTQNKHSSFDADHFPDFEIVRYQLKDITINLEESMKTIISTNIDDINDYDLSLDISNIESVNKTLKLYGLKLIPVNDDIEFLNVNFY